MTLARLAAHQDIGGLVDVATIPRDCSVGANTGILVGHEEQPAGPDPRAVTARSSVDLGRVRALYAPLARRVCAADHSVGTQLVERSSTPLGPLHQVQSHREQACSIRAGPAWTSAGNSFRQGEQIYRQGVA
jgi:hypothetical protein